MDDSNNTNKKESNSFNLKQVWLILGTVVSVVFILYFINFNSSAIKNQDWLSIYQNLSKDTGTWGTFGDYVGGILNPVIAAFAFYLIAKTYELQKRELEATRSLLEISTDAQENQIKLAALTALLNSNFTRISLLEAERLRLFESKSRNPEPKNSEGIREVAMSILRGDYGEYTKTREDYINEEIISLSKKNNDLIAEIEAFSKK
jgi:large-conductance mechanosensitive channel